MVDYIKLALSSCALRAGTETQKAKEYILWYINQLEIAFIDEPKTKEMEMLISAKNELVKENASYDKRKIICDYIDKTVKLSAQIDPMTVALVIKEEK